ncbi:putative aminoacrylate hydrolase RutD [Rubritalea halochordaticola]|uniref:Aminoacrylate hydrolase RutD n=2 Tax=Rubritalea halochordaticola TaxID=714537 RepID=A0ABP9V363_9BACT
MMKVSMKLLAHVILATFVFFSVGYAEEGPSFKAKVARLLMGESGGDRLFYYPTKKQPHTPGKYGYKYEDVYFKSEDGTKLHGWFLPSKYGAQKAKGTIVFSHGNAGALGHHFYFTYWMVREGYNVFMYDYRGYGSSGGKVSRKGLVEDAQAAFRYIVTRVDIDQDKLVSFGHSLGGAKSIAALAASAPEGLRAVIVDSTFNSYVEMAEIIAGDTGKNIVSGSYEPGKLITKLPKVPLLVVHGTLDRTIPLSQAEKLFQSAHQPKTLFKVEGAGHTSTLIINQEEYRKKLLVWLDAAMEKEKIAF